MIPRSILEGMVSTHKRYKTDNFPVLRSCIGRGEHLFHVRLYADRGGFLSVQYGIMRMRVVLGFIEAKTVVIDAVIRTDDTLDYLSVICSSPASPALFSGIVNKAAPRAIIEEISTARAEDYLMTGAVRDMSAHGIPLASAARTVNESRRILLSLLLEYRALLAEYDATLDSSRTPHALPKGIDCSVPFLIFELDGKICGIPAFQVLGITPGGFETKLLRLKKTYGEGILACTDVLCVKEVNVPLCEFKARLQRGYYAVSLPLAEGDFFFTLVVPSLL